MRSACVWIGSLGSLVGLAAAGGAARADTNHGSTSLDFGMAWTRFAPEDTSASVTGGAHAITGEALRFGFGTNVSRYLFVGGDADFGRIDDGTSGDAVGARSSVSQPEPTPGLGGTLHGQFAAARAVVGTRARAGFLSGAAELALGTRVATYSANDYAGNRDQVDMLVEGRGRLDAWITPYLTVGAAAGVDLRNHENVTLGLSLGVHFFRYDSAR